MYLEIGADEFYIECEYEYIRASKGSRNEYGVPMEPDEPSTLEISKVMVDFSEEEMKRKMVEIDLPPQVIRMLEDEILEEIEV